MADAKPEEEKTPAQLLDEQAEKQHKEFVEKLKNSKDFDDDEKKILKLYNEGVQNYAIAKKVFKFVNQDTVGKVVLTIRKAHADDYDEVEDVNSTRGYTGVAGA
jgi:phage terminase small subunit